MDQARETFKQAAYCLFTRMVPPGYCKITGRYDYPSTAISSQHSDEHPAEVQDFQSALLKTKNHVGRAERQMIR